MLAREAGPRIRGSEEFIDFRNLEVARDGAIATITFTRAAKANALDQAFLGELERAAFELRDDAAIRAVIFTGAGHHFSSGADLVEALEPRPLVAERRRARLGERVIRALRDLDQITIAAWNGAAMGGGACIATALDLRIGADDCFMQYPEVDIGLNLMWQSLPLIVALVGPARAIRLVAGGERIDAPTLLDWGVVEEIVPRARLLERASELAERYAGKPAVAAQMIKRSVNRLVSAAGESIMHMDADQNLLARTDEDRRAALAGWLKRRSKPDG
jgi:enoyl-CoA hydratase/carnithine racemase